MNKSKLKGIVAGLCVLLTNCEIPGKPNFTVEQKFELPLLQEKKYFFLGGSDAFIDSTKGKTDTLFTTGKDGVVFISYVDSVEIGDLDDAIPAIDIDPSSIDSEVGVIEIDDFTSVFDSEVGVIEQSAESLDNSNAEIGSFSPSFSGNGNASFLTVTGINAPNASVPILGGTSSFNIDLSAGNFNSANIKSGGIKIQFTNTLGFDISTLSASLTSNASVSPTSVGSTADFGTVSNDETVERTITFNNGDLLEVDLQITVEITWDDQNYTVNALNNLQVVASDDNLVVNSSTAEIASQALTPETPGINITSEGFNFAILSNTEDLTKNKLVLTLTNNTNLPLSNSSFDGFPTITLRNSDGTILDDTKEIRPDNPSGNLIGAAETASVTIDLTNAKLTKSLTYSLDLGTPGSTGSPLTVSSTDQITVSATTSDLEIFDASLVIDPQTDINLSDEASVDGEFVRAEVDNGALNLTFNNSLNVPLSIDNLVIKNKNAFVTKNTGRYIAEGTEIGTITDLLIPANSSNISSIDLAGIAISDVIIFEATASSSGSNGISTTLKSTDVIQIDIQGSLSVNQAEAKLKPQEFSSNDTLEIDNENFLFETTNHYVKLKSGQLVISELINTLDVAVDTLTIKVPSITNPNGEPLLIGFYGNNRNGNIFPRIGRKENNTREPVIIDLANYKINALDNKVVYEVFGSTEDTRNSSDQTRVINSTDKISTKLAINNLVIGEALGKVITKETLLGEDDETNGIDVIDLFNDTEANVVDNESFQDISEKITNLKLDGASLSINFKTNIGVQTSVYMAIAGKKSDGTYIFLKGKGNAQVTSADNVTKLFSNGAQIALEDLVKYTIGENKTVSTPSYLGTVTFDSDNSNVDEFLSVLPVELRTIGISKINPNDENSSFIANPIVFETEISIDIPLALSTPDGPIEIVQDLGKIDFITDIPKEEDDISVNEATIVINYENRIPLGITVQFEFLDINGVVLNVNYSPILLEAATIDANGFAISPKTGKAELIIENNEILQQTDKMNLILQVETSSGQVARVKSNDFISISLSAISAGSFTVNSNK